MSHSVKVIIVADQEITILGKDINIHDLKSITLGSSGTIIGYVADNPKEEFNCSEDYFKDITGDNLPPGDTAADCTYQAFKCKVCGWEFICMYSEGSLRLEILDEMRDHVHLQHK